MKFRSQDILKGKENGLFRALYKSMGYTDEELTDRPIIGIANSWNTLVPGHFNLNQLAEFVKKGIYRAGGDSSRILYYCSLRWYCPGTRRDALYSTFSGDHM